MINGAQYERFVHRADGAIPVYTAMSTSWAEKLTLAGSATSSCVALCVQYMRGSTHPSPFRNVYRVALTNWDSNGEHSHYVERDAPMEMLSSITHLGMRLNCVPEAEEFSFYAFVVGSSSEPCLIAEKQSLVPRALSSRLRKDGCSLHNGRTRAV